MNEYRYGESLRSYVATVAGEFAHMVVDELKTLAGRTLGRAALDAAPESPAPYFVEVADPNTDQPRFITQD